MKQFILGCDMSKAFFDVCYFKVDRAVYLGKFDNNFAGYRDFLEASMKVTEFSINEWFVLFENTGVYSKKFQLWLFTEFIPNKREHATNISNSAGIRRGKTDEKDAAMICEYAFEKKHKLIPDEPCDPIIDQLKCVLSHRHLLVKQKVQMTNSIADIQDTVSEDTYKYLKESNEMVIDNLKKQIRRVEKELLKLLNEVESVKNNYILITSVIGIGLVTAVSVIVITQNFTRIVDPKQFANFIGVAPHPYQSGSKFGKNKVSKKADIKTKALFTNCVLCAINYDPHIKDYKIKQELKGKPNGIIWNNIKNKLIARIFAVQKRGTLFTKLRAA